MIKLGHGGAFSMAKAMEDSEGGNNGRERKWEERELRIKRAAE